MGSNLGFLFAANVFVWGAICFYMFRLIRSNSALKRDLDLLKETLAKETRK